VPLGFHPHPGRTHENSPTLQRWVEGVTLSKSRRDGRIPVVFLSRPFGTYSVSAVDPNAEAEPLGYCRMSLRDKGGAKQWKGHSRSNPSGTRQEYLPDEPSPSLQKMLPPFEVLGYLSVHENGAKG
jgi:hypothetical protein